jgi:hypothetical protein
MIGAKHLNSKRSVSKRTFAVVCMTETGSKSASQLSITLQGVCEGSEEKKGSTSP